MLLDIAGHTLPIKWRAPELMTGRAASIKTDVWSFGILLYVIVTRGGELYKGQSSEKRFYLLSSYSNNTVIVRLENILSLKCKQRWP